jgi:quercetin dioxygenase-like cupin family protein
MPIEVVRFGAGRRRPHGPPGTSGLSGLPIHGDERGVIAELAFSRGGRIEPHSNPNLAWFLVVEGGGWVQVGHETARVAAGDAVLWPPDLPHGAWTEHGEMRAFVVEFASVTAADAPRIVQGVAAPAGEGATGAVTAAEGGLRGDGSDRGYDPTEGEPR